MPKSQVENKYGYAQTSPRAVGDGVSENPQNSLCSFRGTSPPTFLGDNEACTSYIAVFLAGRSHLKRRSFLPAKPPHNLGFALNFICTNLKHWSVCAVGDGASTSQYNNGSAQTSPRAAWDGLLPPFLFKCNKK